MGYTHYWERPRILPHLEFQRAVEDCQRLCQFLGIPLGDAEGQGEPIFSPEELCFNGHANSGARSSFQTVEGLIWPNSVAHGIAVVGEKEAIAGEWVAGFTVRGRVLGSNGDGSYESFCITRQVPSQHQRDIESEARHHDCCKTNYRPYDLCVQGCLIILSHHLGTRRFRVLSDGSSRDWNDARDACQHVLGFGVDWGEENLAVA